MQVSVSFALLMCMHSVLERTLERGGTYYSIIAPANTGQCLFRSSDVHAL
jgi:hypothetical protein